MSKRSVRLTEADEAIIDELRQQWRVEQSEVIRRAIRLAGSPLRNASSGTFRAGKRNFRLRIKEVDHSVQ